MSFYMVKNWADFQHYKDRSPPWIKLHRGILDNYDFHLLPDASRALAPCIWLLASEFEGGRIPADHEMLAFRFRRDVKWIEQALKPLIENGFLVMEHDASNPVAECKQSAIPEEEERESKRKRQKGNADALPDWVPREEWDGFVEYRKKSKAPLTDRAIKLCINDLDKLRKEGNDPAAVLNQSVMRGWKGLFPIHGQDVQKEPTSRPEHRAFPA